MAFFTLNEEHDMESPRVPCVGELIIHRISACGNDKGPVIRLRVDSVHWNATQVGLYPAVLRAFVYATPF